MLIIPKQLLKIWKTDVKDSFRVLYPDTLFRRNAKFICDGMNAYAV